jgi:hypothetical protein
MGAIAGLWNLDGRPVEDALARLNAPLPHGRYETDVHWSEGPVALTCRGLTARAEPGGSTHPLVYESGAVLASDGRLDNREELLEALDPAPGVTPSMRRSSWRCMRSSARLRRATPGPTSLLRFSTQRARLRVIDADELKERDQEEQANTFGRAHYKGDDDSFGHVPRREATRESIGSTAQARARLSVGRSPQHW